MALAYRAIQTDFDARFTTVDELIGDLSRAAAEGRLDAEALEPYVHLRVLVIDLGYHSYAADAANTLYRVVNDPYLHGQPMVFTTDKPLAALGRVLHDGDLAEAILDRVLARGSHFALRGSSYRTRRVKPEEAPRPGARATPVFTPRMRQRLESARDIFSNAQIFAGVIVSSRELHNNRVLRTGASHRIQTSELMRDRSADARPSFRRGRVS